MADMSEPVQQPPDGANPFPLQDLLALVAEQFGGQVVVVVESAVRRESPLSKLPIPSERVIFAGDAHAADDFTPFQISNEHDLWRAPIDTSPCEIFFGFGSNCNWELAMRRNAEVLVMGDIHDSVARINHFLFAPLLAIAEDRAEFLSFLGCIPLGDEVSRSEISDVFNYIITSIGKCDQHAEEPEASRAKYKQAILNRLTADSRVSDDQRAFVEAFLTEAITPTYSSFVPERVLTTSRIESYEQALHYLGHRYDPDALVAEGASREIVNLPNYSVFSSDESFRWLKDIYSRGDVHYIIGDIRDPAVYAHLNRFAAERNLRIQGFNMNNIPEAFRRSTSSCEPDISLVAIELMRTRGSPNSPFTSYETIGSKSPHTFRRIEVDPSLPIGEIAKNAGYTEPDVYIEDQFEAIIENLDKALGAGLMSARKSETGEAVLAFGSALRVQVNRVEAGGPQGRGLGFEYTIDGRSYEPLRTTQIKYLNRFLMYLIGTEDSLSSARPLVNSDSQSLELLRGELRELGSKISEDTDLPEAISNIYRLGR